MKIQLISHKINLKRSYFLKRVLAKFINKFFSFLKDKKFKNSFKNFILKFNDVEEIFYKLNIQREIENIYFINYLSKNNFIDFYIDIGANNGFFGSAVEINNINKVFVEPNNNLVQKIKNLNPNSFVIESAISDKNEYLYLNKIIGNSGISYISRNKSLNSSKVNAITISNLFQKINQSSINKIFVKIDVEGKEENIIKQLLELDSKNRFIIGFESLSKVDTKKCLEAFQSFNYTFLHCYLKEYNPDTKKLSITKIISHFLTAKTFVYFELINLKNIKRDFYPMIFCIPNEYL